MPQRRQSAASTLPRGPDPLAAEENPFQGVPGVRKAKADISVADAVGDYLDELRSLVRGGSRAQNTLETYEKVLDLFARCVGGEQRIERLGDVSPFAVRQYLVQVREGTLSASRSQGSDSYVAKTWTNLVAFFKWCRRRGYPVDSELWEFDGARYRFVIPKPLIEEVDHDLFIWTPEEVELIRGAAKATGPRETLMVEILLRTGIRPSELIRVELDDVQGSNIRVRNSKSRRGNLKPLRWPPLHPQLQQMIHYFVRSYRTPSRFPNLILTVEGEPFSYQGLYKVFQRLHRRIGLNGNPYTYRHTFGTRYLQHNPGQFEKLREIMGHEDYKTLRRYAQLGRVDLAANIEHEDPFA